MANWAIVIGIDQYWTPAACLRGAVRDALNMREWLVSVEGGAVPPLYLSLLLGRGPNSPPVPPGVVALEATRIEIVRAINRLLDRSGKKGERVFFYYSGHGLSVRKDYYEEQAILPRDFAKDMTDISISVRSLLELFKGTHFREQFFIIDACRNIPWEKREFRIGDFPDGLPPVRPVPPQFIMYATSPGVKAIELHKAGDEQGAFTEALLAGLKGQGIAKDWDDEAQEYVLRWDKLFSYVKEEVERRKLDVGEGLIQVPRRAGERGDENPELGRFDSASFADVPLDVDLDPDEVAPQAEVMIRHIGGVARDAQGNEARKAMISELPVRFLLQPRPYSVRAIAPGHRPERDYYPVQLYRPTQVSVRLVPGETTMRGPEREAFLTKGLSDEPTPGTIELSTSDTLARLELIDSSGKILASGEGYLWQHGLAPGFYRARQVSPEGNQAEQVIELVPGAHERKHLNAPDAPDSVTFRNVLTATGMEVGEDNTIEPSEAVGAAASMHLSTILALAGGAVNEDTQRGYKLRRLGIAAFRELVGQPATSGIQVLFGIEADDPAEAETFLSQTRLRCWEQSRAVPTEDSQPLRVPTVAGLGEYAWAAASEPHWLSIETPGQRPIAFAVTVLPNRLALVVFQRSADGQTNIYQYLPSLVPGDLDHADMRSQQAPVPDQARFPVLQRSELIQRAYIAGRLEEPKRNASDLLYAKWTEPIAGVLGGYILLQVDPDDWLLGIASGNMERYFGGLSDSHVLRAEYLDAQRSGVEAAQAFAAALDRGLPVMQEGLMRLLNGIARHGIQHPQVERVRNIYERRVPGLLWTTVPVEYL